MVHSILNTLTLLILTTTVGVGTITFHIKYLPLFTDKGIEAQRC